MLVRAAERDLARLSTAARERILLGVEALRTDPVRARPGADIKALRGFPGQHRLRVGDHRVFYVVDGKTVWITGVRHRSNAYE
jgi:mRNA-degrading endonuclease RelE of RelBE toxin-antitoxin system